MAAQQQKENYQRVLDQTIEQLTKEGKVPTLLLHSCCAPCSSYVLEYLSKYFKITLLYYNPNISLKEEYEARVREQKRLIGEMDFVHPVQFMEGKYLPEEFYRAVKGHEEDKEVGFQVLYRSDGEENDIAYLEGEIPFSETVNLDGAEPLMQEINPSVKKNLIDTSNYLNDVATIYNKCIEETKNNIVTTEGCLLYTSRCV